MIDERPFAGLVPDVVLDAVESLGWVGDGRLVALNSYENRVYRIGIGQAGPAAPADHPGIAPDLLVAKFYREGRWSDAQLLEEHRLALDLAAAELPVAAPLVVDGTTLHAWRGFRFSLFPCWRGTAPDLDMQSHRELLGRSLARFHAHAATRAFVHRGRLADQQGGAPARRLVLDSGHLPPWLEGHYRQVSAQLVEAVDEALAVLPALRQQRLHGDCHLGNVLWNAQGPVFVDLDDCLTGPVVQDLWMLCNGTPAQRGQEWSELLRGYSQFATFDVGELALVEALRALRMLNHAAWVAHRWRDPAFPAAFPWFGEARYWEQYLLDLQGQLEQVLDPPELSLW